MQFITRRLYPIIFLSQTTVKQSQQNLFDYMTITFHEWNFSVSLLKWQVLPFTFIWNWFYKGQYSLWVILKAFLETYKQDKQGFESGKKYSFRQNYPEIWDRNLLFGITFELIWKDAILKFK